MSFRAVVVVAGIVSTWVTVAHLLRDVMVARGFRKPGFLALLNTAGLMVLPLVFSIQHRLRRWFCRKPRAPGRGGGDTGFARLAGRRVPPPSNCVDNGIRACCFCFPDDPPPAPEISIQPGRLLMLAVPLTTIWVASTYLYFSALGRRHTDVSSVSALNQINSSFVFLFSICVLGEEISLARSFAVLFATAGAVLVALSKGEGGRTDVVGDFIMIACACCWGFYEVVSTRFLGPVGLASINLLLGLSGALALFCFWPFLLALHYSGAEEFEWPAGETMIRVLIAAALHVLLHFFFNLGLAKCGPLPLSVAALLIVPSAMVSDSLLHGLTPEWPMVAGAAVLCVSFALANWGLMSQAISVARSVESVDPRIFTISEYDSAGSPTGGALFMDTYEDLADYNPVESSGSDEESVIVSYRD